MCKIHGSELHATNACFRHLYELGTDRMLLPMQTLVDYLGFRIVVKVCISPQSTEYIKWDDSHAIELTSYLGFVPRSVQVARDISGQGYYVGLDDLFPIDTSPQSEDQVSHYFRLRPELMLHLKSIKCSEDPSSYLVRTRLIDFASFLNVIDDKTFNMDRAFIVFSTACNELPALQRVLFEAREFWLPRRGSLLNSDEFWWDINSRIWMALKELGASENVCYVPQPKWASNARLHVDAVATRMTLSQHFHTWGIPMRLCSVVGTCD